MIESDGNGKQLLLSLTFKKVKVKTVVREQVKSFSYDPGCPGWSGLRDLCTPLNPL